MGRSSAPMALVLCIYQSTFHVTFSADLHFRNTANSTGHEGLETLFRLLNGSIGRIAPPGDLLFARELVLGFIANGFLTN